MEETCEIFNIFLEKTGATDPANFRGVFMDDIATVKDIVQGDFLLYDVNIVDGSMIGELARRSVGKDSNTVRLLPYISHICSVSNINGVFKACRYPSCHDFV